MFSMVLVGSGSSHFLIRIRIQENDTDSTDPDPQHYRYAAQPCQSSIKTQIFFHQEIILIQNTTYRAIPVPYLTHYSPVLESRSDRISHATSADARGSESISPLTLKNQHVQNFNSCFLL